MEGCENTKKGANNYKRKTLKENKSLKKDRR